MLAPRISERDFAPERLPPLNGPIVPFPRLVAKESLASVATSASVTTTGSRVSATSLPSKRSSVSSYTSQPNNGYVPDFETVPTLVKTPWELERGKRSSVRPVSRHRPDTARSLPTRVFQKLPQEVYACILQQLESLYFEGASGGCTTCYLHDLFSVSLTSREWEKAARLQLYSRIRLPIDDSAFRRRGDVARRLKSLQWTLRERTALARIVRELHVPDVQQVYLASAQKDRQYIIDQISTLIELCPNLERFYGLVLSYDHKFDKLSNALSSRARLRDKIWSIKAAEEGFSEHGEPMVVRRQLAGYDVDNPDQFLNAHGNWKLLQRLLLFGQGTGSMDFRSFVATFRSLPSLQHLLISNFDDVQFNDRTLQALPQQLQSLRLQDLPGITGKGLLKFATGQVAQNLRNLSLVHLEISSVPVIAKFFALPRLRRFVLKQDVSPTLPHGIELPAPLYCSARLMFLHWDILFPGSAHRDLATSISRGTFPSLRKLRAPNDHDGLLQNLCKPTGDILRSQDLHLISQVGKGKQRPPALQAMRQVAQARVESARQAPFMKIIVEEDGILHHRFTFRGFMGTLNSKIEFCLEPDVEGSDEPLAGLGDLLLVKKEEDVGADGWCSGPGWGKIAPGMELNGIKKGRTHQRRRRIREMDLGAFF